MRVAVVGHIEWIEFLLVERVPAPGEIVEATESWAQAAGGGAVAAVQLAKLADEAHFFTAVGDDAYGRRALEELRAHGVLVEAVTYPAPQRRGFTYLDAEGERTITLVGGKLRPRGADPLPWKRLRGLDAVYFTGGDAAALRAARAARVLVATARELETLREARVELDALVGSAKDESERYRAGDLEPAPRLVARTAGSEGGSLEPGGPFAAAPLPAPHVDAYGSGDAFAACLTLALAEGRTPAEAAAFASGCGAAALTGRGPYAAQLRR